MNTFTMIDSFVFQCDDCKEIVPLEQQVEHRCMNWNIYSERIKYALDRFQFDKEILTVLKNSIKNKQKIFIAGNGGSATIAMHYATDLSKGANKDWENNNQRYQAVPLVTNTGYITAIANDTNYDEIFKQQLINLSSKNDIVILISSSGNSPNIIKAAEYAKSNGLIIIGITGFDGGKLKQLADYSAHIQLNSYEICEDVHAIFGHYLSVSLREMI